MDFCAKLEFFSFASFLDWAGKAFQEQTLELVMEICKLQT